MNERRRRRRRPLLGRPSELEPQIFWLYLGCCWLVAGINGWLHARSGGVLTLALAVLFAVLGVQALWIALQRGRGGDPQ